MMHGPKSVRLLVIKNGGLKVHFQTLNKFLLPNKFMSVIYFLISGVNISIFVYVLHSVKFRHMYLLMDSKRRSEEILSLTPFYLPDFENMQRYGRLFTFTTSEGSTYIL